MALKKTEDISKLTFEQALSELEEIVSTLESGEAGLDKAMEVYSRGQQLKDYCSQKLATARLQVDKIMENGANISLSDFNQAE